jgi:dolichol-phosphate mannosyltransferase
LRHYEKLGHEVIGLSSGEDSNFFRIPARLQAKIRLQSLKSLIENSSLEPFNLIIHAASHGNSSWHQNPEKITQGYQDLALLLEYAKTHHSTLINLGSSSEYGENIEYRKEDSLIHGADLKSLYAVTKLSQSHLIEFYGKKNQVPCIHLRLFSVYGPLELPQRLIPTVCHAILTSTPLTLSNPTTQRDFVYIEDLIEAIFIIGRDLKPSDYGEILNICSGQPTSLEEIAQYATRLNPKLFVNWDPNKARHWDLPKWSGNPEKTKQLFQWVTTTPLEKGLKKTLEFYKNQNSFIFDATSYSKKVDVSVIITCYNHAEEIRDITYDLNQELKSLEITFELITLDDFDPDQSYNRLQDLLTRYPNITLIRNLNNQGSQYSILRGLHLARGKAVVIMDGDGQDPPKVVTQLIQKWKLGSQNIIATREIRDEPFWLRHSKYVFYRIWKILSLTPVMLDAGDFGLIDRKLILPILHSPPKFFTWRSLRNQLSKSAEIVLYARPKSYQNKTTNSFWRLLRWAFRFICSTPNVLGLILFITTLIFYFSLDGLGLVFYALLLLSITIILLSLVIELNHKSIQQKIFQSENPETNIPKSFWRVTRSHFKDEDPHDSR